VACSGGPQTRAPRGLADGMSFDPGASEWRERSAAAPPRADAPASPPPTAPRPRQAPAAPAATMPPLAVAAPPAPVPEAPAASSGRDPLERATTILRQAARSESPGLRANAYEALLSRPEVLGELVAPGLADPNRGVRFVAAMCIGRARLRELAHLVEPLRSDPSLSVRAAALFAMHRCGRRVDLTPLAEMVRSNDPEVRSNAFLVLGELGDRSAIGLIRSSLGRGMLRVNPIRVRLVELQAAEALLELGVDEEIEAVRAALFAPVEQGELSILACQIIARIRDESSVAMLERLLEASGAFVRPPEIRLAAAEALASLRVPVRADLFGLAATAAASPDPLVRVQAAAVLGRLGDQRSAVQLGELLSDGDASVRVAAAGSLLRLHAAASAGGEERASAHR
jgi:HEAT repeat protein